MKAVLKNIGQGVDVSRIYIFLNESDQVVSNVFEWCATGVAPQIDHLQKINYDDIPSWRELLAQKGSICSNNIFDLPQDIIAGLEPQKIKALVVYPLYIEKKIAGFIGFDECRYQRTWQADELKLLQTISGIIANAYERKISQARLRESEDNFHAFFETMEDMLVVSDPSGQIIHANQSLIDKLAYRLPDLKEMTILDLYPEDFRDDAADLVDQVLNEEANFCPLAIVGKFGQTYAVESRIQIGKWNKKDCFFIILKDISQEKENLKLFSKVFVHNPLPMTITSMKDGKISKVNPAFLAATGYSEADLIGQTSESLDFFVESKQFLALKDKLISQGKIKDQELLLRGKDGRLLNGLFSVETIYSQGQESYLTVIVDISERTQLLKNIERHYQKLENIIEGSNLGTWEWNVQTGQLIINEEWAKIQGYSLDQLQPISIDTWSRLTHPDDLKVANHLLQDHLNGERDCYAHEIRMKHKDGHWVWIQDSGKVIERDDSGQPLKMFGTHADISLKKQALEALEESERRFFLALDETKAGLWDFDLVHNTVFLSPMWKQILGYEDHEVENTIEAWGQFWHPDDLNPIQRSAGDYISGKLKASEIVNRLKHKDGSYRWILIRGGVLRDDKGTPTRWIGTNIDVTKEHEQALELERFFSVNLDLLCITDMEGNFIKTNKAWEDILGYPTAVLNKSNFLSFIHPDDLFTTLEAMKTLESGEKILHFVNRYLGASGNYRHIEWRSSPHGNLIYAAARDITKRIEYEEQLLELTNRDPLTNVYNRRFIYSRAEEIIEEHKRTRKLFSICIIDIDHFKKINDSYGHQAGDYILKAFTKIIADNLLPYDLLGRYGGEEFILILNHATKTQGYLIVERILKIMRTKPFICDGQSIPLTFPLAPVFPIAVKSII